MQKKDTESKIEKRRYPRLPIEIKFHCYDREPKHGNGLLHFYSKNLSCGGVYLKGDTSFNIGSVLHMDFKLPGLKQIISVSGVIVRKEENGLGVRFLTLNIDEFETVENFVNEYMS